MSGYDKKTGIFELTQTKANNWYRRQSLPFEIKGKPISRMALISRIFRFYGYKVLKNGGNYLRIQANPDQVWEVLSGMESDPKKSEYYYNS